MRTICAMVIAMVYALGETHYFGWNRFPTSDAEMIADGIAFVLVALTVVVASIEARGK